MSAKTLFPDITLEDICLDLRGRQSNSDYSSEREELENYIGFLNITKDDIAELEAENARLKAVIARYHRMKNYVKAHKDYKLWALAKNVDNSDLDSPKNNWYFNVKMDPMDRCKFWAFVLHGDRITISMDGSLSINKDNQSARGDVTESVRYNIFMSQNRDRMFNSTATDAFTFWIARLYFGC